MAETGRVLTFEVVVEPDEDGGYHVYAPADIRFRVATALARLSTADTDR